MDLWTGFEDAFVLTFETLGYCIQVYSNQDNFSLRSDLRALNPLLHIHAFNNHPQT
jgi:hypothetical protein